MPSSARTPFISSAVIAPENFREFNWKRLLASRACLTISSLVRGLLIGSPLTFRHEWTVDTRLYTHRVCTEMRSADTVLILVSLWNLGSVYSVR